MTNSPFIPYSGHNKLSALLSPTHFTLLGRAGDLLAGLFDHVAPEGYEDETGFHPVPVRTGSSRPSVEKPVWSGEHIQAAGFRPQSRQHFRALNRSD